MLVAIIGLTAIGGGSYLVYTEYRRRNVGSLAKSEATPAAEEVEVKSSPVVTNSNWSAPKPASQPASIFPLKTGSKGAEVAALQSYLNKRYNAGLATDGIWGPKTQAALQKFEQTTMWSTTDYTKMQAWLVGPANTGNAKTSGVGKSTPVMTSFWA